MTAARDEDSVEAQYGPPVCPRAEISNAIQHRCTHDLRRKRRRTAIQRSLCSMGLAVAAVAVFFGIVFSTEGKATEIGAPALVMVGVLHVAALFLVLASRSVSPALALARLVLAFVVPLSFLGMLALTADDWRPISEWMGNATSRAHAVRCAFETGLVGALACAGIVASWYRTDPFTPRLSGFVAGLAGGIVGSTAAASLCSDSGAYHLAIAHGLAVPLLGLVGLAIGPRCLCP